MKWNDKVYATHKKSNKASTHVPHPTEAMYHQLMAKVLVSPESADNKRDSRSTCDESRPARTIHSTPSKTYNASSKRNTSSPPSRITTISRTPPRTPRASRLEWTTQAMELLYSNFQIPIKTKTGNA